MAPELVSRFIPGPNAYRQLLSVTAGSILLCFFAVVYVAVFQQPAVVYVFGLLGYAERLVLFFALAYFMGECAHVSGWVLLRVLRMRLPNPLHWKLSSALNTYLRWHVFLEYKSTRKISEVSQNLVTHRVTELIHGNAGLKAAFAELKNSRDFLYVLVGSLSFVFVVYLVQGSGMFAFSWIRFWLLSTIYLGICIRAVSVMHDSMEFRLLAGHMLHDKPQKTSKKQIVPLAR